MKHCKNLLPKDSYYSGMSLNRHYLFGPIFLILSLFLTGCYDEVKLGNENNPDSTGLTVFIPNIMEAAQFAETRSDSNAPTRAEINASASEATIANIYLIAINRETGAVEIFPLDKTKINSVTKDYTAYGNINLSPATYDFYVVANLDKYIPDDKTVADLTQKSDIEGLVLNFADASNTYLLSSNELPMACLPEDIKKNEDDSSGVGSAGYEVTNANDQKIYAGMSFLCSKVRYTILFDNTSGHFSQNFLKDDIEFKGASVTNVREQTALTKAENANATTFSLSSIELNRVEYPEDGSQYLSTSAMSLKPEDLPTLKTEDNWDEHKRAWQGTYYFPENIQSSNPKRTTISFETSAGTQVASHYDMPLVDGNDQAMKRSFFYDIVGKLTRPETNPLSLTVSVSNWTLDDIYADFVHTYLSLDKSEITVDSDHNAIIHYTTDGRGMPTFEYDNPTIGKADQAAVIAQFYPSSGQAVFTINPDINLATFENSEGKSDGEELEGVAYGYISIGNIKKMVKINYDITPFFRVKPSEVKIAWDTTTESAVSTQTFVYETNLGGCYLTLPDESTILGNKIDGENGTSSYTNNKVKLESNELSGSSGKITVTALVDPVTTTAYNFTAYPKNQAKVTETDFYEDLTVIVYKENEDYRIYFRAINDYFLFDPDNNNKQQIEFLEGNKSWPTEYYGTGTNNNNWVDFWNGSYETNMDNWAANGRAKHHNIYLYYQIGEETGSAAQDWKYNDFQNKAEDCTDNERMWGDSNNPGWYYFDLPHNAQFIYHKGGSDSGSKPNARPVPGKTMIMFQNGRLDGSASGPHRLTYNDEPGIPLFDYEDKEGYILFDPTSSDPLYKIYDEKPTIEDITYIVYTENALDQWQRTYGIFGPKENKNQFTNFYNFKSTEKTTETIGGKSWQKTSFKLKAPKGEYDKEIEVSVQTSGMPDNRIYLDVTNTTWFYPPYYANISKNQSTFVNGWAEDGLMKRIGTSNIYYYDVPEGCENDYLIFSAANNQQWPPNGDGWITIKPGHIMQNSMNFQKSNWTTYTGTKPESTVTTWVKLFDGQNYPANSSRQVIGYYDENGWHQGRPTNGNQ